MSEIDVGKPRSLNEFLPPVTKAQMMGALDLIRAVASTIKEVGEAPEGPLYAALMMKGCSLDSFQSIMAILERQKLISRKGHLATWIGG